MTDRTNPHRQTYAPHPYVASDRADGISRGSLARLERATIADARLYRRAYLIKRRAFRKRAIGS